MTRDRAQQIATDMAAYAETPEQIAAAHIAMRWAFPSIAAAYPCDCADCRPVHRDVKPANGGAT